ncbi:MAG: hypothetical protein AAFY60_22365, partial [Myxococcota bacterium]
YDSGDKLFAHLSMTLTLARFRDGEVMWTFSFDERRLVPTVEFAHAIRILSELLDEAAADAFAQMAKLGEPVEEVIELPTNSREIPAGANPAEPPGVERVDPKPMFLRESPTPDAPAPEAGDE